MHDGIRSVIAPLLAEAQAQGIDLSAQILIATEDPDGNYHKEIDWQLLADLVADKLGKPRQIIEDIEHPNTEPPKPPEPTEPPEFTYEEDETF